MCKKFSDFAEILHAKMFEGRTTENNVDFFKKCFRFEIWREILNLFSDNAEFVKIDISIYQSIGNDETNLMVCLDSKLLQNLKSYALEKF